MDMNISTLTSRLEVSAFTDIIQLFLPIIGVAVLVGFVFYVTRWAIGLFRGI
jgi:hypothetical protein